MNLIDKGIEKGLIRFDEERNFITYIHQNIKRNFNNPEEKVQAEAFLTLVLIYGYPINRVKNYVTVQMGSETRQADKSVIQSVFTDKVNLLKEELTEKYFLTKQSSLDDYPIFMAIAEDIGYDATGRNTDNNELIEIGKELSKFIAHINKTEK